jgi:dimethylaniline monooxygenase (N-oxide forming)
MFLAAVDISSELAPQAKELHVITRKGGWIIPRFVFGKPVEAWDSTNPSLNPENTLS